MGAGGVGGRVPPSYDGRLRVLGHHLTGVVVLAVKLALRLGVVVQAENTHIHIDLDIANVFELQNDIGLHALF